MSEIEINDLSPCLIYIDKEGLWYHKGVEMIRRDFIRMFFVNIEMNSQGRYVINWGGKLCYIDVEDTAFVIRNVQYLEAADGLGSRFILFLSDGSQEDLMPDTLSVGKDHVLYCRVKDSVFPARFNRAAYYNLAMHVKEENDVFYLPLDGIKYEIQNS